MEWERFPEAKKAMHLKFLAVKFGGMYRECELEVCINATEQLCAV
jgi:hypothetical protein